MNEMQTNNPHIGVDGDEEDPLRKPLGSSSPTDTPRTSCIKENLYRVTSIPIDYCLSRMEHLTAGSNNRSGFRGVRQVRVDNIPTAAFPLASATIVINSAFSLL